MTAPPCDLPLCAAVLVCVSKCQIHAITPELIAKHGLTPEEYERICGILGREPNFTELGVFSVMWSEHCSYKNSKLELRKFPTNGERVLVAAGEENAGVIDIGDDWAVAFKMESHNHPSAIEPFQGAATGVGGIIRDIFTMGATACLQLEFAAFWSAQQNQPTATSLQASLPASPTTETVSASQPSAGKFILTNPTPATRWSMSFALGYCGTAKSPAARRRESEIPSFMLGRRPDATGWLELRLPRAT